MINRRIWPSIIGGVLATGFNWTNVASISPGILMPASLHLSGFMTGFLIVFMTLNIVDIFGTQNIFRSNSRHRRHNDYPLVTDINSDQKKSKESTEVSNK